MVAEPSFRWMLRLRVAGHDGKTSWCGLPDRAIVGREHLMLAGALAGDAEELRRQLPDQLVGRSKYTALLCRGDYCKPSRGTATSWPGAG